MTLSLSRKLKPSPEIEPFRSEVIRGLRQTPRELPCKYFYDERGSHLFDQICELDEYYLTRTEQNLMERHAAEMATLLGPDSLLIEYGSGSSVKTQLLLEQAPRLAAYVPVDVSREHMLRTARRLEMAYPGLTVLPVCADFTKPFPLPTLPRPAQRRVVYFPGSTLGNFRPPEAEQLLAHIARQCGVGGALLLGIDLRKDLRVLEPAYNDAQGVTAAFNLNLLVRANRELGANFPLEAFRHHAPYNPELGCIEMFLVCEQECRVTVGEEIFAFQPGDRILTERSHKYDLEEFRQWVPRCGLQVDHIWTDPLKYFAVLYLTRR